MARARGRLRRGRRGGQGDDRLELPFAVLDDGSTRARCGLRRDRRAPGCGERDVPRPAGRHTARHGRAARDLLAAGAVPQTGPLPGVYAKAMLPDLESRVARGELSLRGVNPTCVEVDEAPRQRQHADRPRGRDGRSARPRRVGASARSRCRTSRRCASCRATSGTTALWAAKKLRRGEVFTALDASTAT